MMQYAKKKNCCPYGLMLGFVVMFFLHSNHVMSASLLQIQAAPDKQSMFYSSLHPKPSSPIDVQLQPVTEPVPGQINEFKLTVSTKIDVSNIVTTVELPAGWKMQSGSPDWQGALSQGQEMVLRFRVMIPESGRYTLVARAIMGDSNNGQLAAVNSYSIGQDQSSKLLSVSTQRYRMAARNGQQLIQYKIP